MIILTNGFIKKQQKLARKELEKLQEFIKNSIFIHSQNNTTQSV